LVIIHIHVFRHEDGTIKIWEASGICLDNLYKIKTKKIFEKRRTEASNIDFEHPYKITNVAIYSNYMAVAAVGGHVTLYKYTAKKAGTSDDGLTDVTV
jgi:syntaxin-binding protein 5